jgi:hypothetical protein
MNFGRIDMRKLADLARSAGISDSELETALAARNLSGLSFVTGV